MVTPGSAERFRGVDPELVHSMSPGFVRTIDTEAQYAGTRLNLIVGWMGKDSQDRSVS